jgi:hypothetical protein
MPVAAAASGRALYPATASGLLRGREAAFRFLAAVVSMAGSRQAVGS